MKRFSFWAFSLCALLSLALATLSTVRAAEGPLTNDDVVKLVKLDLGDEVVIAKIKAAPSVNFDTSAEALTKLKEAGVGKLVLAAIVDRTAPAPAAAAPAPAGSATPTVTLVTVGAEQVLASLDGNIQSIVAPFVGYRRFAIFPETRSKLRINDRKPSVLLVIDKDPRQNWWFVKLDQDHDDNDRSIDVQSPGMWGGVLSSAPEKDFMVAVDLNEERPGVWRFLPKKELKPGEYGLYHGKGESISLLFDFGIDK